MASLLPALSRRVLLRDTSIATQLSSRSLVVPCLSASRITLPNPSQIRHSSTTPEVTKPPPSNPLPTTAISSSQAPLQSSPSVAEVLDLETLKTRHTALLYQPPWYTTVHIHSFPYLVTLGDKITLPALLYGPPTPSNPLNKPLQPGDIIRLTHASTLGSREYTIKGAPFIDERLFTCRARVVEITSEPMREKKKTKRRNRKVKTVKSKHRYTVLSICELKVNELPEFEVAKEGEVAIGGEAVKDAA